MELGGDAAVARALNQFALDGLWKLVGMDRDAQCRCHAWNLY